MALNQDQSHKFPLVSVGIPVFNGGRYIRQTLDSLLAQDYPNIEFIISDNASTDHTAKICLEYAANDPRITFVQNDRNIGGEANFERVLELATGKYFMWAAHDDLWNSAYIPNCVDMLQKRRDAVLCCSSLRFIDKDGALIKQDYDGYDNPDLTNPAISERVKSLISRKGWYAIYGLIKSSILKEALRRVRKTRNKYGYDVILLLQLCLMGPFCKVPHVLFYYRQKGRSEKDRYNETVLSSAGGNQNIFLPYTSLACNIINTVLNSHLSNPTKEELALDLLTLFAYDQIWHYRFRQYNQLNSSNHIKKSVEYKRFIDTLPFEPRKLLPFVDHGPQKQCAMGLRCALIEFNAYHDEVIPTFIYLLNELGIAVDVFMSRATINKGIFECTKSLNFSLCEIENISFLFYEKAFQFCDYDFVIINSLEPKQWLHRTNSINIPIIGVIHNGNLLTKDSDYEKFFLRENRVPIALAKHIPNSSRLIKHIDWISPVFLNDTLAPQSTQKPETVSFVVSGNLEPRRNYNSLLDAAERLVSDGVTNFRINIVGYNEWSWGKAFKRNVRERGLSAFFAFSKGTVDYKTYFSMVMDSDFILPLLDQTDSKYLPYFVDKCTSSIHFSIGLGVVPILHERLSEIYSIPCGITYKEGELFHALKTAARWDGKSLNKCRNKLYEKRLSLLHDSKNNFQKILKGLNINVPCSDKNIECNRLMSGQLEAASKILHEELNNSYPHPNAQALLEDICSWTNKQRNSKQELSQKEQTQAITIFTIPKPFKGHIDIIQRNAIKSWTLLRPRPEIILLGNDEGTAEIARELGLRHIPHVERNEFGTPLLNSIFAAAEANSRNSILAYVNADIILMDDFVEAIGTILKKGFDNFLMVGQRWDIDISDPLDFQNSRWENDLKMEVNNAGSLHAETGVDYFVFPKGMWGNIPPFALGRTVWDNWLIHRALDLKAHVIDATQATSIIHQNHDYAHIKGGIEEAWNGEEAKVNLALAGGYDNIKSIAYARWIIRDGRLVEKAPALNEKGEELYNKGDIAGALAVFKKVIEIDPSFATAYNNLGVLYWQTGKAQKAVDHFEKALKIDLNDKNTIFNLGSVLMSLGKFEDARNLYSLYLQRNPEDEEVLSALETLERNITSNIGSVQEAYDKLWETKLNDPQWLKNDGKGRVEFCADFLKASNKINNNTKLLDIGCGRGTLKYFLNTDVVLYGVDISKKAILEAQKIYAKADVVDLNSEKLPYEENAIDIVTALDVIEHVFDPLFFLREIHRVLKPGGQLVLSTPNILQERLLKSLVHSKRFPKTSGDSFPYDGGHIHFFTYQDVFDLMKAIGFATSEPIGPLRQEFDYEFKEGMVWVLGTK